MWLLTNCNTVLSVFLWSISCSCEPEFPEQTGKLLTVQTTSVSSNQVRQLSDIIWSTCHQPIASTNCNTVCLLWSISCSCESEFPEPTGKLLTVQTTSVSSNQVRQLTDIIWSTCHQLHLSSTNRNTRYTTDCTDRVPVGDGCEPEVHTPQTARTELRLEMAVSRRCINQLHTVCLLWSISCSCESEFPEPTGKLLTVDYLCELNQVRQLTDIIWSTCHQPIVTQGTPQTARTEFRLEMAVSRRCIHHRLHGQSSGWRWL